MKSFPLERIAVLTLAVASVLTLCAAYATHEIDVIRWGYSGVWRAHENVSGDGTKNYQSKMDGARTAIELRPTLGTAVTTPGEAFTEHVLYHTTGANWSRMNWSALTSTSAGPHYRFGVEYGGEAGHLPIGFAFEVEPGQPAQLPLQLVPDGGSPLYVEHNSRAVLDCNPLPNRGTGLWLVFENEVGDWTFQRVEVGPPDSGDTGFRILRIAN